MSRARHDSPNAPQIKPNHHAHRARRRPQRPKAAAHHSGRCPYTLELFDPKRCPYTLDMFCP